MEFFRLNQSLPVRLVSLVCLLGASAAFAGPTTIDPMPALTASLTARDKVIQNIAKEDIRSVSQWALNTVVAEAILALRGNGDHAMASNFESEWNQKFSNLLTNPSFTDLGDHKPLSKWLANFYDKLEDRLGSNTIHNGIIGDVYDMNYALPIVFSPKGDWRTKTQPNRDWAEYRKHFIPMANVITYWSTSIACNQLMAKQGAGKMGKKICGMAADKLRHVMGRYIAPKISDFAFGRSNGIKSALIVDNQDLVYLNARDLAVEIQKEGGFL